MARKSNIPDFFIIGAPKCGTTSLAIWLGEHPEVFMCKPKEPYYYCPDVVAHRFVENRAEYERLLRFAGSEQCVGEASTAYLRSRVAVPRILSDRPDARFVVCLRNPVDMAPSVHAQLLSGGRIRDRDFKIAWKKQITWFTPSGPECIRDVCSLGTQVERLLSTVPRNQVLFVLQEDLKSMARMVYKGILDFIDVGDDGRTDFTAINTRLYTRSIGVARATSFAREVKSRVGVSKRLGIGPLISKINSRPANMERSALSPDLRRSLLDAFRCDIELLESLIGRDLSHWRDANVM